MDSGTTHHRGVSEQHKLAFGAAAAVVLAAALASSAYAAIRWRQLARAAEALQLTLSPQTPLSGVVMDAKEMVAPCLLLEEGTVKLLEYPTKPSPKVHPEGGSSSRSSTL